MGIKVKTSDPLLGVMRGRDQAGKPFISSVFSACSLRAAIDLSAELLKEVTATNWSRVQSRMLDAYFMRGDMPLLVLEYRDRGSCISNDYAWMVEVGINAMCQSVPWNLVQCVPTVFVIDGNVVKESLTPLPLEQVGCHNDSTAGSLIHYTLGKIKERRDKTSQNAEFHRRWIASGSSLTYGQWLNEQWVRFGALAREDWYLASKFRTFLGA